MPCQILCRRRLPETNRLYCVMAMKMNMTAVFLLSLIGAVFFSSCGRKDAFGVAQAELSRMQISGQILRKLKKNDMDSSECVKSIAVSDDGLLYYSLIIARKGTAEANMAAWDAKMLLLEYLAYRFSTTLQNELLNELSSVSKEPEKRVYAATLMHRGRLSLAGGSVNPKENVLPENEIPYITELKGYDFSGVFRKCFFQSEEYLKRIQFELTGKADNVEYIVNTAVLDVLKLESQYDSEVIRSQMRNTIFSQALEEFNGHCTREGVASQQALFTLGKLYFLASSQGDKERLLQDNLARKLPVMSAEVAEAASKFMR